MGAQSERQEKGRGGKAQRRSDTFMKRSTEVIQRWTRVCTLLAMRVAVDRVATLFGSASYGRRPNAPQRQPLVDPCLALSGLQVHEPSAQGIATIVDSAAQIILAPCRGRTQFLPDAGPSWRQGAS